MPTTEERLTDLETATAQIEAQLAGKAPRDSLNAQIVAVESEVQALETRIGAFEDRLRELLGRARDLSIQIGS